MPPARLERWRTERVPTVGKMLTCWLEEYGPQLKPSTRMRAHRFVERDLMPVFSHSPVTRLTPAFLWTYVEAQIQAGQKPTTVRVGLSWLRRAVCLLWRRRLEGIAWRPKPDQYSPAQDITDAMNKCMDRHAHLVEIKEALTEDECERLMATTRASFPAWAPYVQLAIATGMRRSELRALMWDCVDLRRGIVIVRRNFSENELGSAKVPRGAKHRRVHLSPGALELLRGMRAKALPDIPFVFHIDGQPYTQAQVGHAMAAIFAKAEIPEGRSLHSARRFYVTQGREHMSDAWMQAQVGHSAAVQKTYTRTEQTLPPELSWADF